MSLDITSTRQRAGCNWRAGRRDAALSRAEAAARGYVLTGSSRYKISWQTSSSLLEQHLRKSRQLLADDPTQLTAFDWLDSVTTRRLSRLSHVVGVYERWGLDSALADGRANNTASLSDAISARIDVMQHRETGRLAERTNAVRINERSAIAIIAVSTILTLIPFTCGLTG